MDAKTLNTIGLVLSIVGSGLWFFFGLPQPTHQEGVGLILEDNTQLPDGRTPAEHDADVRKTKEKYQCISKTALVMIILGFVFQLWATWK